MASNKFIKLTAKINAGVPITLYLGANNFAVTQGEKGVKIHSGDSDSSWLLHESEKYEEVIARIDSAMRDSEMLPRLPAPGYKDM